ncbi:MAG: glycosyltransferase family 2 protein [Solobacterium sp.]|nr:glycosyltransferase family 2 protein [Solobacterium sp.]
MLTVIVPCYNEEKSIPRFMEAFQKEAERIDEECTLLFVNDGSKDDTLSVLKKTAEEYPFVHYISLSRNFGKEAAMYAGLCNAETEYTAIMDADLQDPPELLHEMLDKVKNGGYDCAATRRKNRKGEPKLRSLFSDWFYSVFNRFSDIHIDSGARDFRLMNRKMRDALVSMSEYNRFSKGLFSWVGFKTYWFSYENIERSAGKTKWNFWGLFRYALDGIVSFSDAPLTLASWFGFIMTLVSFIALVFIVVRKLIFGDPVAGWASTICVIIFIGGIQLFSIGIIGTYISKIFTESKRRPVYIIDEGDREEYR